MTKRWLLAVLGAMVATASSAQEVAPAAQSSLADAEVPPVPSVVTVTFNTSMGDIRVALERDRAPVTVANFLRYVDAKRFDGITWYRALKLDPDGKFGLV